MKCSHCDRGVQKEHSYCPYCGTPLKGQVHRATLTHQEVKELLELSFAFEINNMVEHAKNAYLAILEQHPNFPDVHFRLGNAYEAEGQIGKAIASYKKAISINPNYIDAHRKLGELYSDEVLLHEAITEFKAVLGIKVRHRYADVHNNLGVAY